MCVYTHTYVVVLSICTFEGALATSVVNTKQNGNSPLCPHLVLLIPQNPMVPSIPGASRPL